MPFLADKMDILSQWALSVAQAEVTDFLYLLSFILLYNEDPNEAQNTWANYHGVDTDIKS